MCSFAIKPRGEPSETDAAPVTKSVAQYFQETYNVTLQYPRLQCAVVRNNGRLPLEVRAANQGGYRFLRDYKVGVSSGFSMRGFVSGTLDSFTHL